jgi:hypothetical protein
MKVVKTIRTWNLPLKGLLTHTKKGKKMRMVIEQDVGEVMDEIEKIIAELIEFVERGIFKESQLSASRKLVGMMLRLEAAVRKCRKTSVMPDGYKATDEEVAQQEEMIERKGLNDAVVVENATTSEIQ